MKKILFAIAVLAASIAAKAQNGLESVIVEKYYVANAADSAGSTGALRVGSTTYRIYADLLPGYNFQALYGVPSHALIVNSTTSFFNNEDYGTTSPNGISATNLRKNTVMLDSWFSVGSSGSGKVGVLKSEDTDGTIGNANGILANTVYPINGSGASDGMIAGTAPAVTFVGIANTGNGDLGVFDGTSLVGGSFSTSNGSIAALGGATGPTSTNRVLIGQFTTNGIFSFELNIQIGTPTGGTQSYVARNPVGSEISIPSLMGTYGAPNSLPSVNLTSPTNGSSFITGATVPINATATDSDGSIATVEFIIDNVVVSVDNTAPYTYNYTAVAGNHVITARATDNDGGISTTSPVNISVTVNALPVVAITAPAAGALYTAPAPVTITANASDANGSVVRVEFYVNGSIVGSDNTAPYSFVWTSVIGNASLTARAIDNDSAATTSNAVNITVLDPNALPYKVVNLSQPCANSTFCLPIAASDTVRNVIGYDIVLNYNKTKVSPSGSITVSSQLINPSYVDLVSTIDTTAGTVSFSLFFNSNAPANAAFFGRGQLVCVEFNKTSTFNFNDTANFSLASIRESYYTGVVGKLGDPGKFISYKDSSYNAEVRFWGNNAPLAYDAFSPSTYLQTKIYGNNGSCNLRSSSFVSPNTAGQFTYNLNNGQNIEITRDIAGTTSVQPVINGFDAYLARKVLVGDASFVPSVYQMIAMDVNIDGVVSAGDVSQMNQRAVLMIPEFRQAWNYNASGVSNGQPSKDWSFIDATTARSAAAYQISTTYPSDNGVGFSRFRVPVIPFCLAANVTNFATCPEVINGETYRGILIGDINGNFGTIGSGGVLRTSSNESVVFDLAQAVTSGENIDIPVYASSSSSVNAVDFAFSPATLGMEFVQILSTSTDIQSLYNVAENVVRFTSNSMSNMDLNKPVAIIRVKASNGLVSANDFNAIEGYINGDAATVSFSKEQIAPSASASVRVYPNPAADQLNVEVSADATVQLMDITGRDIVMQDVVSANQTRSLNISNVANGIYMIRISSNNFTTTRKIVVQR